MAYHNIFRRSSPILMADQKLNAPISESEQMYLLKTMQLAARGPDTPVPVSALAQALEVQPVSANQMVHSLQEAGLMEYLPYKGVQLTPAGARQAELVLRYRRLWQAFLHEQLGLDPQAAESIACEFEHATTEEAADRLERFLENTGSAPAVFALTRLTPGQPAVISGLASALAGQPELSQNGLALGAQVSVLLRGPQGDLLLQTPAGNLHLSAQTAAEIQVQLELSPEKPLP